MNVRCPPSMTRVLHQWGLKNEIDEMAQVCDRINWYSGPNAEPLGSLILEHFVRDVAANLCFLEHGRLHDLFLKLAKNQGVDIKYNSRVIGADSETGYVSLENGEQVYGDVIIAADGYNSAMRDIVVGEENNTNPEKTLILSFGLPSCVLQGDPELQSVVDSNATSYWLGDGYFCVGNLLNKDRDFAGVVSQKYSGSREVGDWTTAEDIGQTNIDFGKLDTRASVDSLVCENSRIALVGGAAHPLLYGANHNHALGFEDAQALGCLFSRLQCKDQVSQLLTAYNEIRQPWSQFALAHTYRHHQLLRLPVGPEQQARDALMRPTMRRLGDAAAAAAVPDGSIDEPLFRRVWGGDLQLFAYDARERVEDWWSKWGASIVKKSSMATLVVPRVQVSVSTKTE
ncbi:FAD-dependent monooxygenase OpS4 [Psilocybe cubensis]|nr:FAD-dependent monooxygenase OpS4 [Psilocybe cubensis]KAH9475903.1 FAD-dependent monooxygenase OpS4 [Psilocybe cubensis]